VDQLVKDAVADGATLVTGGRINSALAPGLFYEPTVLTGVKPGMRITKAEVFGPVCVVMSWKSHEELLAVANDCDYALGSSIFSTDPKEAKYLLNSLHAGMTNINDFGINYLAQSLPFGGVKHSGFGHFGGPEGLRACCNIRSITDDALPKFLRPAVPKPLQYPTTAKSPEFAAGLMRLSYGPTPIERVKGIFGLIRGSM
jgi:acyl-CoA reductase-like NAD-dependent aldehyde dehydrogenase